MERFTARTPAHAGKHGWRLAMLAGAFALSALAPACFEAPGGAVTFACDLFAAPECPEGYVCQSDGCCHEIGADVEANAGACRLGGQDETGGTGGESGGTGGETGGTGDTGDTGG